jgi:molybdenum cofactor biosynthesis enzyme MoaA
MDCFGCNYRCSYPVKRQLECIKRIEVAEVNKVLQELLQEISTLYKSVAK